MPFQQLPFRWLLQTRMMRRQSGPIMSAQTTKYTIMDWALCPKLGGTGWNNWNYFWKLWNVLLWSSLMIVSQLSKHSPQGLQCGRSPVVPRAHRSHLGPVTPGAHWHWPVLRSHCMLKEPCALQLHSGKINKTEWFLAVECKLDLQEFISHSKTVLDRSKGISYEQSSLLK